MNILGIESASLVASAAVWADGSLLAEYTLNMKKTHSQTLLPMIDEMLRMLGMTCREISAIAVSAGPGSFTGLRIGAATAKGIGFATGCPVIPVPTIDAMAYGIRDTGRLICPMLDARRQQVYTGLYCFDGNFVKVRPQFMTTIDVLAGELNARGEEVIFLGDGVDTCGAWLEENLRVPYAFASAPQNRQRAALVAALGEELFLRGESVPAEAFRPEYLRKSQAEQEQEIAEKQGELDKLAAGIVIREHA